MTVPEIVGLFSPWMKEVRAAYIWLKWLSIGSSHVQCSPIALGSNLMCTVSTFFAVTVATVDEKFAR